MESNKEKVVVVGGGLVGVCTAYFLSTLCPSSSILLIDRRSDVAQETSFANAGRFVPSSLVVGPPASPKSAKSVLASLFSFQSGSKPTATTTNKGIDMPSSITLTPSLTIWGMWYLRNCTPHQFESNTTSQTKLAFASISATNEILKQVEEKLVGKQWLHHVLGFAPQQQHQQQQQQQQASAKGPSVSDILQRHDGTVYVYDTTQQFEAAQSRVHRANAVGLSKAEILDCDTCLQRFPFLHKWKNFSLLKLGCISVGDDWSADSRMFVMAVKAASQSGTNPVSYRFNTSVTKILLDESTKLATGVMTQSGEIIAADKVVLCGGLDTAKLALTSLGLYLPIQPMRGYSIDLLGCDLSPEAPHALASIPEASVAHFGSGSLNFQITPFNNGRIRVVGFAEFNGDLMRDDIHEALLLQHIRKVLPFLQWKHTTPLWCGVRPMTPDNLPIVGQAPQHANVFINAGHGSCGWTLSAATAKLTAECVALAATTPAVRDLQLQPDRFSWWRFVTGS